MTAEPLLEDYSKPHHYVVVQKRLSFCLEEINFLFLLFPAGNVEEYAKHLFRVLDTDKDNQVSFQEVMLGFHNLSQAGDEKEKLKLVFQMYDIDGNKIIDAHNVKM